MNDKRDAQALRKLINHIGHTLEYCQNISFQGFMENRMLQEACVFNVLQIGELSRNALSDDFKASYPDIPWQQMYGLRNRLVHDYQGIRMKIVWDTITCDFKPLRDQLSMILSTLE